MRDKLKLCILTNENKDDHVNWALACNRFGILYDTVDLTSFNWLEKFKLERYDYLLAKPPGISFHFKQIYDERIHILSNVFNYKIYPTPLEIYLYENKKFLYSWLDANGIPHPKTWIFFNKEEAFNFIKNIDYPIVGKSNIGASGSGVVFLNSYKDAFKYILKSFSKRGITRRWWPNLQLGNYTKRLFLMLSNPNELKRKIKNYMNIKNDPQHNFIILQEYIPHTFEWRIVAIGDSFFAHKKLKRGKKASGTLLKDYSNPPLYLFDFAKNIMDKYGFVSQAIDVFEPKEGKLLINEMQCIFGQSDPYQMLVNGKPGRYKFFKNNWVFEEGDFAKNSCYDLRVEHVLQLISYGNNESIIRL